MFFLAFAARRIAAERIDRLWCQPDMRHHRYATRTQEGDRFCHRLAALELDRRRAGFGKNAAGRGERLRRRGLVAAERHVDDDQRVKAAAHNRGAVRAHHVERDRQRRGEAVDDLA